MDRIGREMNPSPTNLRFETVRRMSQPLEPTHFPLVSGDSFAPSGTQNTHVILM